MSLKKDKLKKLLNLILVSLATFGLIQLFTYSFDEEKETAEFQEKLKESYNIFSLSPPKKINFAGEQVPTQEPEVYERLDREIHSNTYFHSNTILYFKKANRWFPVIEPILAEHNIPDDFKYLALIESGLQNVVSPAGATGFWQFLEDTGREYGLEIKGQVDERYHVEKSTEAACKYLQEAYEKYGSWSLAAASYNTGMRRISSELERQKTDNYYDLLLNSETGRYVFRILAVKEIMNNPEAYGFKISKKDLYPTLAFQTVTIDSSVTNFADFAKEQNISYKILKHFNPWLREAYLRNPSQKAYTLKLPTNPNYQLN
ncbi:MAG: lytic transglycosylase domain-containing protein [Vicingaceae bacterium]